MVRFHCEEDGERAFLFLCTESIANACRLLAQFYFLWKACSLCNGNILSSLFLFLPSTLLPVCVCILNEYSLTAHQLLLGSWPGLWASQPEQIYIELDFSQRLNRYRKTRGAIVMHIQGWVFSCIMHTCNPPFLVALEKLPASQICEAPWNVKRISNEWRILL